ncbi:MULTISPECIES: flagellar hook protein FlgE [Aminobacterium]|uniref:flagellar hook protein FlgE n=1 Tax=Aminobacterium TaxID=81466 RepID=UPI00257CF883|nr:flagellar hook protein FlgE [Aminobacterium sp. UBA4834]
MLRSLMTGVSGVRGHQTLLDVVGNNIANVNTVGFKKSTVTFQDLLYQTSRGASSPQDNRGGINPMQVGLGVNIGAIETIHSQGQLQYTGNRTDMAIQGDGYYVMSDGGRTLYSRAGNFILDANGNIVQSGTGYMLKGYTLETDPNDPTRYIKGTQLVDMTIPVGQKLPAKATTLSGFRCNLDSRVGAYLPMGFLTNGVKATGILNGVDRAITFGTGTDVNSFLTIKVGDQTIQMKLNGVDQNTKRPKLNDNTFTLDGNTYNVTFDSESGVLKMKNADAGKPNDAWEYELGAMMDYEVFSVAESDGTEHHYLVEFNDLGSQSGDRELVLWGDNDTSMVNRFSTNVTASHDGTFIDQSGKGLSLGSTFPVGELFAVPSSKGQGLEIRQGAASGDVLTTINQRIPSTHVTKLDVFDSLGNSHTLEVSWEKIDNNQWRWRAWLPTESGITLKDNTGIISFGSDGKIETASATPTMFLGFGALGAEDASIKLDFSGRSFGKEEIEGVTQYGSAFTTKAYYRDGYEMGVLNDFAVGSDGTVVGVYSNGESRALYRLGLAIFANPSGLEKVGNTAFIESANSGIAQVVSPLEGGAGKISGGSLEMGNVDLSEEFVRLIIAQRGFQANARVVTTSDQVLEELVNMKR